MIQADWIGMSKEDYECEKEFELDIQMNGKITISAKNLTEAINIVENMSNRELLDYIDDVEIC